MKIHVILLWIALIVGGSFGYYYFTHRNNDCVEFMECYRSFKQSISDRYASMKESVRNKFYKTPAQQIED